MSYVERTLEKDEDVLIYHLLPMADGTVWLATGFGLIHFQRHHGALRYLKHDPADESSLSHNIVKTVCLDPHQPERYLWCGTAGGGLSMLNTDTGTFRHFSTAEGLPGTQVSSILADSAGDLWIGTESGMCRADVSYGDSVSIHLIPYNEDDGVDGNDFNYYYGHNAQRTDTGEIVFTSKKGLNIFNPASIQRSNNPIPLWLTGLEINYQEVQYNDTNSPLPAPVSELRKLTLPHHFNTVTFKFAGIDLKNPEKICYTYKLDNVNDSWIHCGKRRAAHYTQLDPGKYIFRLKAANSDGVCNQNELTLQLTVTPPWWRSFWAYLLYAFMVLFVILGLFYSYTRRNRLKNELFRKSLEAQKLYETDKLKSRFFANISHEFRTPLTLVNGLIARHLKNSEDAHTRRELTTMQRHLDHLLKMINELLDLSALEVKKMTLRASNLDIVLFMKRSVAAFESAASQKRLTFRFKTEESSLYCYFDPDKIRKVMYNLFNNALKFTPEGGSIDVTLSVCVGEFHTHCRFDDGCVCITVRDTGRGIPSDQLPYIFDHFYQVHEGGAEGSPGSGIGLALVKELVELHHGSISVTSKEQTGTSFTINIPLGNRHLKREEIIAPPDTEDAPVMQLSDRNDSVEEGIVTDVSDNGHDTLVLVIEDNADLRTYIHEELAAKYRVITAAEGEEGISKAIEHVPDMIVSDVMMPGMDGFEVCAAMKSDERTSHIPVILLTAKGDKESRLTGLELGADDYLTKPFDSQELLVRMKNLVSQRKKLRERYQKLTALKPSELDVTSPDQAFLQKALASVEKHMGEENFSVLEFAREVGMSRTQLHRKLKALTNQSAGEFIQHIRLQRAADLIRKNSGNVSDIAYQVGFSDPSYFSRLFKKQFGKTPSDFVEQD